MKDGKHRKGKNKVNSNNNNKTLCRYVNQQQQKKDFKSKVGP